MKRAEEEILKKEKNEDELVAIRERIENFKPKQIIIDDDYIYAPEKPIDNLEEEIQKAVDEYVDETADGGPTSADYFVNYFEAGRTINKKTKAIMTDFQGQFRYLIKKDRNDDFVIELIEALKTIVNPNVELQEIINEDKRMYKFFDIFDTANGVNYDSKMNEYIKYYRDLKSKVTGDEEKEIEKFREQITKLNREIEELKNNLQLLLKLKKKNVNKKLSRK